MGLFGDEGPIGGFQNWLYGGPSQSEKEIPKYATAPFEDWRLQQFLPYALRSEFTGPILKQGIAGLGELIRNPGGLSPTVAAAIAPRLQAESENIAGQYRGLQAQQAGAAARGNLPVSIKNALAAALDIAQERAQRGARREALSESEVLRRQDLSGLYQLLNALFQFTSAGRGQALGGLSSAAEMATARQAANMAHTAAVLSAIGSMAGGAGGAAAASGSRFKEGFSLVRADRILDAIRALPVYEWSYKGEKTRHVGPMAEEFMASFGTGDNPDVLPYVDAIGTLMAATQALASKVERLEARG